MLIFIASSVFGDWNNRIKINVTENFSTSEVYDKGIDEKEWKPAAEYFPWVLHSGLNKLRVRVKNKADVLGKPSLIELNLADRPNLSDRPKEEEK